MLLNASQKTAMNNIMVPGTQKLGWDNTVGRNCGADLCKNGGLPDGTITINTYMGITKCSVPIVAVVNSDLPANYQPNDGGVSDGGDIIGVVENAKSQSATPGTAVCCDGTTPCGSGSSASCCSSGQICRSNFVCGSCSSVTQSCNTNGDCCSGTCTNHACSCGGVGGACKASSDCCDGNCVTGQCVCLPTGHTCSGAGQCCGTDTCTLGVCKAYTPPPTCNGTHPPYACSAGWRCCGTDGWTCGLCR